MATLSFITDDVLKGSRKEKLLTENEILQVIFTIK